MKFIKCLMPLFLFILVFGCSDVINNNHEQRSITNDNNYPTLNLNNDQCVPGGFSEDDVSYYLNIGYTLDTLHNTKLFTVDFAGDDGGYQMKGYVEAGAIMLINPFSSRRSGYFKLCGNHWLDEEDN